jgi:hypothetical protein
VIGPGVGWLDAVLGRAAVEPAYRELLLAQPAMALTGVPLSAGLLAAVTRIRVDTLREFAQQAIAAKVATAAPANPTAMPVRPSRKRTLVSAA